MWIFAHYFVSNFPRKTPSHQVNSIQYHETVSTYLTHGMRDYTEQAMHLPISFRFLLLSSLISPVTFFPPSGIESAVEYKGALANMAYNPPYRDPNDNLSDDSSDDGYRVPYLYHRRFAPPLFPITPKPPQRHQQTVTGLRPAHPPQRHQGNANAPRLPARPAPNPPRHVEPPQPQEMKDQLRTEASILYTHRPDPRFPSPKSENVTDDEVQKMTLVDKDGFATHLFKLLPPGSDELNALLAMARDKRAPFVPTEDGMGKERVAEDVIPADVLICRALEMKRLAHVNDGPRGGIWVVEKGREEIVRALVKELGKGWKVLGVGEGICEARVYMLHACGRGGPDIEKETAKKGKEPEVKEIGREGMEKAALGAEYRNRERRRKEKGGVPWLMKGILRLWPH